MKKYSGKNDPHLHMKQYVTYMKATRLFKAQIVRKLCHWKELLSSGTKLWMHMFSKTGRNCAQPSSSNTG